MPVSTIITKLHHYGHLRVPIQDLDKLTLSHPLVIDAARSYQQMMAYEFQPLVAQMHGRMPVYDGHIGPATMALFDIARCDVPDFAFDEATGAGSWPSGCNPNWALNHVITVAFTNKPPVFLAPVFETVWQNVVAAYAEIGIYLIREDGNANANITASFVTPDGGWIGLAIVGRGQRCNTSIWARFDVGYGRNFPQDRLINLWTSLIKHELGHNMGLSHSQGGVMNPSILYGLPVSWIGDPSHPLLVRWFGGVPVPIDPQGPEMWVTQCLKSDRGREICLPLHPPKPVSTTTGLLGV